MMRKLAAAFLGLLLCIALTGCGPSEKQRAVYNDDSLIAAQSDTYFYIKHLSTQSGTEYTENFGSFTGSDTLWSRNAKEGQTLHISGSAEIKEGSWKLVLVDPEGNGSVLLECGGTVDETVDLSDGNWRVKSVGLETKGFVQLTIEEK